jgi:preprotein translocase subunit YajC
VGSRPPAVGDEFLDPHGAKETEIPLSEIAISHVESICGSLCGSTWLLFAQAVPEIPGAGGLPGAAGPDVVDPEAVGLFPQLPFPVLIAIMFGLFYFLILRPQQSKDKKFRSMLERLKEKDRVVTIGGIHGVVTNVLRDRDEVTVRIDEATGTKIRVGTSAIARLVTDEEKNEKKTT